MRTSKVLDKDFGLRTLDFGLRTLDFGPLTGHCFVFATAFAKLSRDAFNTWTARFYR